ncbi:MAG: hypothetical protein M1835_003860 [Candelina submexicana]|nr:MAG: hypothetical protein M1835_003860 [Candelina submexicana]
MYRTWDPGWYRIKVYIATIVETCVGIVCASVPALRPFFVKYWPRFRLTTQRLLPSYVKDISSDASTERSRQHSHAFSLEPPPSRKRPSQTEFDLELLEEDFVPERSGRSMESNLAEGLSANQGASPAKEVKFITRAI